MPQMQKASDDATTTTLLQAIAGFIQNPYDYITVAYPTSTTETYTFKTGGAGGTAVGTITVTYTDATKSDLSSVGVT